MPETFKQLLKAHEDSDSRSFSMIGETLEKIKDNHLAHMEQDSASMKVEIEWIKKILWIFLVPVTGGFVGILYQIVIA